VASFNDANKIVINVNLKEKRNKKVKMAFLIGSKNQPQNIGKNSTFKEKYTKMRS
jgi:hypothetical protein